MTRSSTEKNDEAQSEIDSQDWEKSLSDHKAKLQRIRETSLAAVHHGQWQDLVLVNEELYQMVDQLWSINAPAGLANWYAKFIYEKKHLDEQMAYQRLILDQTQEAMVAFDKDLTITFWNDGAEKLYGYSAEETLGRVICDLLGKELTGEERKRVIKKLAEPGHVFTEVVQNTKKGEPIFVEINSIPLLDQTGQLFGHVSYHRNITARIKAEEQHQQVLLDLEKERTFWHTMVESMLDPVTVCDAQGRATYMNEAYKRLLQTEIQQGLEMDQHSDHYRIFHPDGTPFASRDLPLQKAALENEKIHNVEIIQYSATGQKYNFIWNAVPLHDSDGLVVGAVAVGRDITAQRAAEAALKESEERFRNLIEATSVAVWRASPDGKFILELSGKDLFGHTSGGEHADNLLNSLHPDDRFPTSKAWQKAIGAKEFFEFENRLRNQDGSYRWISSKAVPRCNTAGDLIEWIGISSDINDRKKAEQAVVEYSNKLWEYSEQLETRVKERTEELVNIQRRLVDKAEAERLWVSQELHDGPMQEIYGLMYELSYLEDALRDTNCKNEIISFKDKLKEINENLRTIARELRPTSLTPFGLEKAIREHGEKFDREHPEVNVTLNLSEDGTLLSEHVRLSLFRIYQTALANVIRHAQAKNVTVNFLLDAEFVVLEIQDDGVGFEVPQRIRALARQGHLGLAGAVERAEMIGGKLEVESASGKGTRLRVITPLR